MLYSVINVVLQMGREKIKLQCSCVTAAFFQSGTLRLGWGDRGDHAFLSFTALMFDLPSVLREVGSCLFSLQAGRFFRGFIPLFYFI